MTTRLCIIAFALIASATASLADVSEQEAIQAQVAGAMASADYAAKKCPNLQIDQGKIDSLVKRSGKTVAELKASEDYAEQRDVLAEMAKGKQAPMICMVLHSAHGGYARGVITEK